MFCSEFSSDSHRALKWLQVCLINIIVLTYCWWVKLSILLFLVSDLFFLAIRLIYSWFGQWVQLCMLWSVSATLKCTLAVAVWLSYRSRESSQWGEFYAFRFFFFYIAKTCTCVLADSCITEKGIVFRGAEDCDTRERGGQIEFRSLLEVMSE